MAYNWPEKMQPLIGYRMLTNPDIAILFGSTALNLKRRKELEIRKEMSVEENLSWCAPQSVCATRWHSMSTQGLTQFREQMPYKCVRISVAIRS